MDDAAAARTAARATARAGLTRVLAMKGSWIVRDTIVPSRSSPASGRCYMRADGRSGESIGAASDLA
jgi:hypothetical protein